MQLIEWVKTHYKGYTGLLTGPVCQMVTERMNADIAEIDQCYSYAFYQRYNTSVNNGPLTFDISADNYYWLFAFRAFWPNDPPLGSPPIDVSFRIYHVSRDRKLTNELIPVRIATTPAEQQPAHYAVNVNNPFLPDAKFQFYIAWETDTPEYVDIMTEGVRIPSNLVKDFS